MDFSDNQNRTSRFISLLCCFALGLLLLLGASCVSDFFTNHSLYLGLSPIIIIMPSTPPTSPQRHQEAARHAERSSRLITSPEQRRTPAGPSTASTSVAPPPAIAQASSRGPVTFGEQTFHYLPSELVAQMADVPSVPSTPRRGRPSTLAPPTVSLIFLLTYKSNIKLADNHEILFCWPIL